MPWAKLIRKRRSSVRRLFDDAAVGWNQLANLGHNGHVAFKVAVLISGGGSTLRNLLERSSDGRLHADVCGVIASRACPGLAHAAEFNVPGVVISRLGGEGAFDPAEFSTRVTAQLREWAPDLVLLGGFLSPYLPAAEYEGRVLNVHPALLPQFGGTGMYGMRVHEAVLASGGQVSGCTVHMVDESYDSGAILAQRAVPVLGDDTPETLAARIQVVEQELYPEVVNWFADGRMRMHNAAWRLADRRLLPPA